MHGLKGDDGRWIQDEGMFDIVCLSKPRVILEGPSCILTLTFYSNNEPHLNFQSFKNNSIEVMKFIKRSIVELKKKFDELGYDRIFVLVAENDKAAIKKTEWLGFKPILYYDSPVGIRFIKYEMETV